MILRRFRYVSVAELEVLDLGSVGAALRSELLDLEQVMGSEVMWSGRNKGERKVGEALHYYYMRVGRSRLVAVVRLRAPDLSYRRGRESRPGGAPTPPNYLHTLLSLAPR